MKKKNCTVVYHVLSAPVVCAGWCIEYRLIEYRYVFLLFLPSYIIRSDVNRVSFHKAVVSMKSNNHSINQWYLLPTISPVSFPTSSPFIYCFLSLHMCIVSIPGSQLDTYQVQAVITAVADLLLARGAVAIL